MYSSYENLRYISKCIASMKTWDISLNVVLMQEMTESVSHLLSPVYFTFINQCFVYNKIVKTQPPPICSLFRHFKRYFQCLFIYKLACPLAIHHGTLYTINWVTTTDMSSLFFYFIRETAMENYRFLNWKTRISSSLLRRISYKGYRCVLSMQLFK